MGETDHASWISSGIKPQTNAVLVKLGVFQGIYSSFLISVICDLSVLIFLFLLDLLSIMDSAGNPRAGKRRGELWSALAFNISTEPFQLICELERMSRGNTLI